MTQEEKDIVLHGARFEMMNRCIDFKDGTVDREKMLNAMQRYAEMYHHNELSKLHQPTVSGAVCENPHCVNGIVIEMYGETYRCGICEDKQTER